MKTLEKTMTEFVLEQDKFGMEVQSISHQHSERTRRFYKIVEYAKLLSTPLTLGMFIPCDGDGNVLEEPEISFEISKGHFRTNPNYQEDIASYQKALSNVLFEGFEWSNQNGCAVCGEIHISTNFLYNRTIEDLIPYKLKLTDNFKL